MTIAGALSFVKAGNNWITLTQPQTYSRRRPRSPASACNWTNNAVLQNTSSVEIDYAQLRHERQRHDFA